MKKALIFLHKWLGVALALLFLIWFASGLVLYFVPFPSLTQAERFAGQPTLQAGATCCLTAQQAADRAGLGFAEARLGMHAGAPVWRLLVKEAGRGAGGASDRRWAALDAASGAVLPALDMAAAAALAERFSGRRALHAELLERDQWTVAQGFNAYRPLLRVELEGPEGLELYVTPSAAEVVAETRRSERAWNWIGAVPHWIYFTELRRWPDLWHNVVVWLSLPGVLLALTGVVLGIWQLYLNRSRWIPYRKFWMRWHHILGLAASVVTLTWIFSGLLSMNPFSVFSPRGATPAEKQNWSGKAAVAVVNPARALELAALQQPREIDLVQLDGQSWYRVRGAGGAADLALLRADVSDPAVLKALPEAALRASLLALRRHEVAAGEPELARLSHCDDLYYAREANSASAYTRPLPVWRAQWADGVTVYADPTSARLLLRADGSNRWQRVLYNGLHSFDFAPLTARPWLRTALIVLFSLMGVAMCVTACVVAWRVLVPRKAAGFRHAKT